MLMNIPIISPIELQLDGPPVRRLPAPDYEIHALPPGAVMGATTEPRDPAIVALDEIDRAAQISEYHDFSWWDARIRLLRARIEQHPQL